MDIEASLESLKSSSYKLLDAELHKRRVDVLSTALKSYSTHDIQRLEEADVTGSSSEDIMAVKTLLNLYLEKTEEFLGWMDVWRHDVARILSKLEMTRAAESEFSTASTSSPVSLSPRSSTSHLPIIDPIQPDESISSLWVRLNMKPELSQNKADCIDALMNSIRGHPVIEDKIKNLLNQPPKVYEDHEDKARLNWKRCDFAFRINPSGWTRVPSASLSQDDVNIRGSRNGNHKRRRRRAQKPSVPAAAEKVSSAASSSPSHN